MKAYSSSNKQTMHFPKETNDFSDPMDLIFYPLPHATSMDANPPTMLLPHDYDIAQDEVDKNEIE